MANEVRLIDAHALSNQYKIEYDHADAMGNTHRKKGWQGALQLLYDAPTIDPETLRPTGHWNIRCYSTYDSWTQETDEEFYLECSECKRAVWNIDQSAAMGGEYRKLIEQYPYCHCGCKMEG